MNTSHLSLLLGASFTLLSATALADPPNDDHFEASMGFLATGLDHRASGFVADSGGPALADTFRGAPYDNALGLGLRYDLRVVLSHVRMTAGVDLPFTSLGAIPSTRADEHAITTRSLSGWSLRFGLGAEHRFGRVVPFVDLQGAVHHAETTITVDARPHEYSATVFGFSARAGLRVHLKPWFFVSASGEAGIIGPTRWSADLSVGCRIGS